MSHFTTPNLTAPNFIAPHFAVHLVNESATDALGRSVARTLAPGLTVFLHGDLGAGKTALTRAILHAAGVTGPVKSPTYTLVEPYEFILDGKAQRAIHFDLYRMVSPEEFVEAGFRDMFDQTNICIVEWPEKGGELLPMPDLDVTLTVSGTGRQVELRALSELGRKCLQQLHFAPNL